MNLTIQPVHTIETLEKVVHNKSKQKEDVFAKMLNDAKGLLEATSKAEQEVNTLTNDFITGKNDNIHTLMIAQEKSGILLQLTTQVRNNILDAYREIMRLQV